MKTIQVPTGKIIIGEYQGRKYECLSLGDYGKAQNIKADFLGNTKEIDGVPNGEIIPLSEKWVITISSQFGCSMGCKFCDVPMVGRGVNIPIDGLRRQVLKAISVYDVYETKRLNIHYARMGEPTFNKEIITNACQLKNMVGLSGLKAKTIHPVVSTMMPKSNKTLHEFIYQWCSLVKNDIFEGEAGLQLSINSTDDQQRDEMFSGSSLSLEDIAHECCLLPKPEGRKYTLNFAVSDNTIIDADRLRWLFSPEYFIVKITPVHITRASVENNIQTSGGYEFYYPYKKHEENLKKAGFDVLVFVPSKEEDEGMITCGNAVLSGRMPINQK